MSSPPDKDVHARSRILRRKGGMNYFEKKKKNSGSTATRRRVKNPIPPRVRRLPREGRYRPLPRAQTTAPNWYFQTPAVENHVSLVGYTRAVGRVSPYHLRMEALLMTNTDMADSKVPSTFSRDTGVSWGAVRPRCPERSWDTEGGLGRTYRH